MALTLVDPLPKASRVTVFGLGWTGTCAANLLRRLGKDVTVTDTRDPQTLSQAMEALRQRQGLSLDPDVQIIHGPHSHHGADACVMTQTARYHDPFVVQARALGIPVIPEVELAAAALPDEGFALIAIAGTDGKTTTTKLAHHLVSAQRRALVGGNSWTPLSGIVMQAVDEHPGDDSQTIIVAEVSAFQAPPWHGFKPLAAAVTNVAEDHVDEFFDGDFEAYAAAKRAPTDRLTQGQTAVLNMDDPIVSRWQGPIVERGARVVRMSLTARAVGEHPHAAYRHNGQLRLRWEGKDQALIANDDLKLVGDHNAENVLTATGLLLPLNLDLDLIRQSLHTFKAPAHRLEYVATVDQIDIYDDSKATNAHASLAGLAAFGAKPLVAIVGGVDKGLDLEHWVQTLRARARAVFVIGELRQRLLSQYAQLLPQAVPADDLTQALHMAHSAAKAGDVLILSPACSSFDMFASYADRGRQFQAAVKALANASDTTTH